MSIKTDAELKAKFETGKSPTYQDFVDLVDSKLSDLLADFPNPLPAVSGKNLQDIGDALPTQLPARDGSKLYNINPQEYNVPSGIVPSYASANTFVVTGDYTSAAADANNRVFLPGRRLRLTIAGSYVYTEVLSASYNAGSNITTVTTADNMPGNQLTACAVGIVTPYGQGGAVGPGVVFGTSNTINGAINYAAAVEAVAGTDYTGTHSPALSAAALVAGLELRVKFPTANTSTAPRYNPNALGYKKIFRVGGSALLLGDIVAGGDHCLSYNTALDGGAGGYVLLNPKGNTASETVHKSADYNIAQADNGKMLIADAALNYTLPAISGLTLPFEVTVKLGAATNTSMGAVCSGTDKIVAGGAELASTKTNVRGCFMKLVADSTGKWQAAALKWGFESSGQTPTAGAINAATHYLGVAPQDYAAVLIFNSNLYGYLAGEEIILGFSYSHASFVGATVKANSTTCALVIGSSVWPMIRADNFDNTAVPLGSMTLKFRANL